MLSSAVTVFYRPHAEREIWFGLIDRVQPDCPDGIDGLPNDGGLRANVGSPEARDFPGKARFLPSAGWMKRRYSP